MSVAVLGPLRVAGPDGPVRIDSARQSDRPELLAAALALWRGRPFAEVDHPSLQPEVARLVELRAAAAEKHAEALLAAGRSAEAVAAAEALVVAEPLRESAVALLMRALVAVGRQADALAAPHRHAQRAGRCGKTRLALHAAARAASRGPRRGDGGRSSSRTPQASLLPRVSATRGSPARRASAVTSRRPPTTPTGCAFSPGR
jgi:hypothetical protein